MVTEDSGAAAGVMLKPGVGSAYDNGWRQLWKSTHFGWLLLIIIVSGAISMIPGFFTAPIALAISLGGSQGATDVFTVFSNIVSVAYGIFIGIPVTYGVMYAFMLTARNDKLEFSSMFAAFRNYGHAVLAGLLIALIVSVGTLFFVVPGIIFACKLAFVPYLVVEDKMSAGDAIAASWKMTRGHAGTIFLIGLLSIPIVIAGVICFFVGVIIAEMWVYLAFGSIYHAVKLKSGEAAAP